VEPGPAVTPEGFVVVVPVGGALVAGGAVLVAGGAVLVAGGAVVLAGGAVVLAGGRLVAGGAGLVGALTVGGAETGPVPVDRAGGDEDGNAAGPITPAGCGEGPMSLAIKATSG